jgi:hypothetical protein
MATTTSKTAKAKGAAVDAAALAAQLHADAAKALPGYTVHAAHGSVGYDRITLDGGPTLAYLTPQRTGLRLDLPRPGGKYEGVKVSTAGQVGRAVATLKKEAAAREKAAKAKPKPKAPKAKAKKA